MEKFKISEREIDEVVFWLIREKQMTPDQAINECVEFPVSTYYAYMMFQKVEKK